METISNKFNKHYFRRGIIYFLTCNLVFNTWLPAVMAEVVLQQNIEGNITVSPLTDGIQNMKATDGAIGRFSSFDIAAGDSVNCLQPSNSANALFRVFSDNGTQILGSFKANGNIYLIDPAGILFGANSQINVNQLVASSLDIANEDFLAGHYEFAAGGSDTGAVTNYGNIIADVGVALIGRKVLNAGSIKTGADGFVVMAAGDRVLLGEPGSDIVVEMDSVTLPDDGAGDVINDGHIESPAGTVVLAAGDIFSTAMELPKVSSGIGSVEQNGHIHTDGASSNGGGISLTAADEVILTAGSLTTANAGTDGDSGLVVVHSKGQTTIQADAEIEAIGGHVPHDIIDDFDDVVETSVEISGDYVNFAGDVDASAMYGKRGKIIIDALNMTIEDGYMPDDPPDNTVYEKWIEAQSYASTDVELLAHAKTGGNIIAEPISDGVIEGGSGDIVLRTKYDTGGIEFMPGPGGDRTAIHTTEGGNVYMLAGGDDPDTADVTEGGIVIGDIISFVPQHAPEEWIVEPGKIRLLTTNYGDITTGQLSVDGGSYDEISVIASGDLLINGDVTTYAHQVDEDLTVSQARTCLVSEHGDVEVNGLISVEAHAKYESTADIHIDAGRDVRIDLGGGQIQATALTSAEGTANASVLIHAGRDTDESEKGSITIANPKSADKAIYLRAQTQGSKSEIYSDGKAPADIEITDGESRAKLELDEKHTGDCPDCPTPPGLVPPLDPWAFVTHMGVTTSGDVLTKESLIIIRRINPMHGELQIDYETGEYEYTPEPGFVGEDSFTYQAKVTDSGLESDWVTVTITVINELPVANSGSTIEHMGVDIENKPLDYSDVPDELGYIDDDLTVEIVTDPLYGDVTAQKDETSGTWTYTYVPDKDDSGYYTGPDSFEYTVTDPQGVVGDSGTAQVTIIMTNDPPVLADDTSNTHMGDPVSGNVLVNDVDINGDSLAVALDGTTTEHGQLTLNEDGSFTYIPYDGYVGEDSFIYQATDGELGESGEPVVFTALTTINIGNNTPNPVDDTATTDAGVPVGGNVLANDIDTDSDPLSVVLNGTSPQHGQLVLDEDGTFTYMPDEGFDGQDSFTYLVTDGQLDGEPAGATVTVTVNPIVVVMGDPDDQPPAPALPYIPPAPGLERVEFEISGCPALVSWAAAELGIDESMMQIWAVNTLASSLNIQPCDACEKLKNMAGILRDDGGTRIAALAQVVGEYASSTAPPTPEQMASVADVISRNAQANNHYAAAGEYLDAIVAYVGILNNELAFSTEESIMFAVDKYVAPLAEDENAGLAAFIAARLTALGGS
ncbi:MAG: Ig-like domain-containing protein [Planctomycetota bacterium]|jgi:filamentous hemagglutinin family protein